MLGWELFLMHIKQLPPIRSMCRVVMLSIRPALRAVGSAGFCRRGKIGFNGAKCVIIRQSKSRSKHTPKLLLGRRFVG